MSFSAFKVTHLRNNDVFVSLRNANIFSKILVLFAYENLVVE